MPLRKDRDTWSPAEDAYLREMVEQVGASTNKIQANWPKGFAPRSLLAIRMRKTKLGLHTRPDPLTAQRGVQQPVPVTPEQTLDVRDSGDTLVVTSLGTQVKTLDELVARAKIDLTKYEVDRPETSMYETTARDDTGKLRKVQNFRIVARFRLKTGPSTQEQVEALIRGAFQKRPAVQKITKSGASRTGKQSLQVARKVGTAGADDLMQAVCIADPHLAKYAWGRETGGQDYDLSIASRLVSTAAHELLDWGDTYRPAVRYIVCLGDLLHFDNPHGHTTSGTPQDRDTRLAKMLEEAQSVLCGIVERSAAGCETRVVMVPGNHDRQNTLAMQLILAAYFRGVSGVSVDIEPTHRKYIEWGQCLIGMTHGDTARKRLAGLMQVERKEAWGRSRVREWHHGHFHREAQTVTEGGVTIREHLSLSPPDSWHAVEGYVGAPRGMDSFLYAKDGYLRGMWRSPVLDG